MLLLLVKKEVRNCLAAFAHLTTKETGCGEEKNDIPKTKKLGRAKCS
jgi:hypothetical protein